MKFLYYILYNFTTNKEFLHHNITASPLFHIHELHLLPQIISQVPVFQYTRCALEISTVGNSISVESRPMSPVWSGNGNIMYACKWWG